MSPEPDALVSAVSDIKAAIQNAQQLTPDILISKAELDLKTTLEAGPNASFKLGPVEFGGKYTASQVQTLSLKLTPAPRLVEPKSLASDALTAGIVAVNLAAKAAASSAPAFGLDEATVEINFGTDKSGKVTFIIGGEGESTNTHTMKLTLKSRS
jgi:hypothetical protein